ncbi:MAG: type I-B CRISPR-associated protein Cas7/Cst2/DevR [Bacteroidales bacterium]|nr:type I-B CRISPR-associated protein Cas7/Cst2/DevR [Bacteroidales bacterium]
MMKRIKSLTLTILTESPVALSNDQGTGGNYTPIKKMFHKDGTHLFASVATLTYELRKQLHENFNWKLFDVKIKSKNLFNVQREDLNKESDLFGYLLPGDQINRTSPLRIIPPISINKYRSDTQLITNKGFLNKDLGRSYFDDKGNAITDVPTTQALANEEIMGDYYVYTITLELDRIGRIETTTDDNGKILYVDPTSYIYKDEEYRKSIVTDLIEALSQLTRTIKHQTILLQPLAVFGGLFDKVIPYFSNSIDFQDQKLNPATIKEVIEGYSLKSGYLIQSINPKIDFINNIDEIDESPLKSLKDLRTYIEKEIEILKDEDSNQEYWYIKDGE